MNANLFEWEYLDSTKIYRIGYYNNRLYVEFNNEDVKYKIFHIIYEYEDVPKEIYERILNKEIFSKSANLPSYGATLYHLVQKNDQYKYNKLTIKL